MTNNIEVHRAGLTEPTTITIGKTMHEAVQESRQSDRADVIMVLADRDAKLITNALIDGLPMQTLALVRDRLMRFATEDMRELRS